MANSRKVKVCAAMFLLAVSLMASLFVVSTGMTFGLGFSVQDKHHVPLNNKNQHTHTYNSSYEYGKVQFWFDLPSCLKKEERVKNSIQHLLGIIGTHLYKWKIMFGN